MALTEDQQSYYSCWFRPQVQLSFCGLLAVLEPQQTWLFDLKETHFQTSISVQLPLNTTNPDYLVFLLDY